ncbi:MAG: DeoR/GlpR family DNA-binding transcription regulator, partial [Chloroflexota bacterium]
MSIDTAPGADAFPRHLAPQRQQRILDIVSSRGAARLEDLGSALGVSVATARRDVDELASRGVLRRVHGGAVANDAQREPHFEAKAVEAAAEKERIAAKAVSLLSPDDTVYLDSGSTVLAAARLLR